MNTVDTLREIYNRHRKKYLSNPDSGQMCCMWSTLNPPDDIFNSDPIISIENKFDIEMTEDDVIEIYDMDISEAANRIEAIMRDQC